MLVTMHKSVDAALDAGSDVAFDYDPVTALEEHCTIDGVPLVQLGEAPPPKDYEKAFWAAWLSQYAWTVGTRRIKAQETYYERPNVGGGVWTAINEAAGRHGESAAVWIAKYGSDSERRARHDATRANIGGGMMP
jgi:hypothetical protein